MHINICIFLPLFIIHLAKNKFALGNYFKLKWPSQKILITFYYLQMIHIFVIEKSENRL